MTFTYQQHRPSFSTAEERDAFFRSAHRGVAPGTSMRQVLATNIGVWGDERALMRDVAEMMTYELDTWADNNGEKRLGLPSSALLASDLFRRGFDKCRKPNRDEIEFVITSHGYTRQSTEDVSDYTGRDFVKRLYESLCTVADQYDNENQRHQHALSHIGVK